MPGCKQGDLAVIIYNDRLLNDERQYVGTFITCGQFAVMEGDPSWEILKPSQPMVDQFKRPYGWVADYCLFPIRGAPKARETDKVDELEHML